MNSKIRLTQFEIDAITTAFTKYFLSDDHLWVFGSRVDMQKRGGDIDLYVETNMNASDVYDKKLNFILDICDSIGEQKIDVVINTVKDSDKLAIYDQARKKGVQVK